MTPSLTAARASAIARRGFPIVVGAVAWKMRGPVVELASPSPCPGLLEFLSIAAVRINPELHIGPFLEVIRAVAIVAAVAAFVELAACRTRNRGAAAAAALAIGLSPLLASTLSPQTDAAAFGVSAAAALLAMSWSAYRRSYARFFLALLLLLVAALLVPPWLVVAVVGSVVAGAAVWPRVGQRWIAGAAAATALAAVVVSILSLSPPGVLTGSSSWREVTACAVPAPSAAATIASVQTVAWWLGPFALGLAALGAFVEVPRAGARRSALVALVAFASLALAASAHLNVQIALAPVAVALWWLAVSGLNEVVAAIGPGTGRRAFAALLLLLLPTLEASRRLNEQRDDWMRPRGHETQTLHATTTMLNQVAQNASFVEEDATVDLMLRAALVGGRRRGKPFTVIAPRPDAVRRALAERTVYAFPRGQDELNLRGFVVDPLSGAAAGGHVDGVATITGMRRCQVVGETPADFAVASTRVALSADAEAARGPVTLYLGGATAVGPFPDGWALRTIRGFRFAVFDQLAGTRSARLQAQASDAGVPPNHPVLNAPFVVRLTLHRTPRAPLALPVVLGAPFPVGVAVLERGGSGAGHLTVCDAPPINIAPLTGRE